MRQPLLKLFACVCLSACGGDKSEAPAAPSGPIVGVLELPVSLRSGGKALGDAYETEVSPTEIRVAGELAITLGAGMVPAADRQGAQLPKLAALFGKAHHAGLALAVASAVPYDTVALVLSTAKASGARNIAIKVRAPGNSSTTGWLALDKFEVGPRTKSDDPLGAADAPKKSWADFTSKWDEVQAACRTSPTGSCAFKPEQVAEGGDLKIVLHAAGQGVNLDFFRIGGPPPQAAAAPAEPEKPGKKGKKAPKAKKGKKVELLDGVKRPSDPVADVEAAPPATEASFQFRAQEAVSAPSAVSEAMKPVCGGGGCAVAIQSEKNTLFVRVASLIGAAFPDGTPAPHTVFELPP
jgi:biopolymer transport protein ExbD